MNTTMVRGKHLRVLIIASFFIGINLYAENSTAEGQFKEANAALESGNIEKAERGYLELFGKGFEGAALYYNLGNLYSKKGEQGKAILWYERAKRILPRDSDIEFNLSLSQSHIKDEKVPLIERFVLFFNNKEIGYATLVFIWIYFIFLGMKMMGWIQDVQLNSLILWSSGFALIITSAWFVFNSYLCLQDKAIVIVPPGEIRNGPGTDYPVGFTIPEGSRVLVLQKRPDWDQIGVSQQGLKGWIPAKEIDFISVHSSN